MTLCMLFVGFQKKIDNDEFTVTVAKGKTPFGTVTYGCKDVIMHENMFSFESKN